MLLHVWRHSDLNVGLPPIPDFLGCPRFVPYCSTSRQDQPDAKCPGFQGKVKMMKIIHFTLLTYLVTYLIALPCYQCTGSDGQWPTNNCRQLQIASHQKPPNHTENFKSFLGLAGVCGEFTWDPSTWFLVFCGVQLCLLDGWNPPTALTNPVRLLTPYQSCW